jgi:hypothetical protein
VAVPAQQANVAEGGWQWGQLERLPDAFHVHNASKRGQVLITYLGVCACTYV